MRFVTMSQLDPSTTLRHMPLVLARSMKNSLQRTNAALCLLAALLLALPTAAARAQGTTQADYSTIVVFGDSLSDTGNAAHLTEAKYGFRIPGPLGDYTDGRFTDGYDTLPPAINYFGVWVEQLAASLPSKPEIKNSLDGGTDYAYGDATTGKGTTVFSFGPSDVYSVNVDNIGQQITDYLSTHPKITKKTLFVVWGGANDLLQATSSIDVIDAGINQTLNIQRLIDAGATQFLVLNLPPLGLIPRLNGSPSAAATATEASTVYNDVLAGGVALLRDFYWYKSLKISQLDVFTLFDKIVAAPATFSLANVTSSSQAMPVDPDMYLFWDDLHPTTHGHNILAEMAGELLAHKQSRYDRDARPAEPSVGRVGASH